MMSENIPALIARWRALDRDCTGDGRPWPVGDRLADALESLSAPPATDEEQAKAEAERRFPDSDTHTDEEADFQSTARYSFQEGAAWERARRPSPVTREALGKLIWDTSRADEGTISVTGANIIADAILSRFVLPEPAEDEWCREESCQYRHWRSGSMPTHKRGAGCPPPVPVKGTEQ